MTAGTAAGAGRWWIVLGSTVGLIFSTGPLVQFSFGVFVKPVAEALHTSRAQVSLALFLALALTGLLTPLAGRLVDRFGVRRFGVPTIVLFALSFAMIGLASTSIGTFMACYALLGIFGAGQTPLIYAKAVASAFDARRGLALGFAMAGVGVGTAVVPAAAQHLISALGWRTAYVVLGAATLGIATPSVALLLREPRGARAAIARVMHTHGLTGTEALRSSVFWKLMAAFFMVAVASSGVMAHIVPMLTDRGVPATTATLAVSAGGVALIAGRLVAGYALDLLFAPYVALFFFAMPLLGIAIILATVATGYSVGAAILVGLGLGAEVDLIAYLQSRYLGLCSFGEIYSYFLALFLIGSGLGPFVMGVSYAHGGYSRALVVFAIGLLAACASMLSLPAYVFGHHAAEE